MEKLLLHTCCTPCANQPIDLLLEAGTGFQAYFGDSNIQPESEYLRRLGSLVDYSAAKGIVLNKAPYERGAWYQAIGNDGGVFPLVGKDPDPTLVAKRSQRCRLCYRFRFQGLAAKAAEQGFGRIATTLAISPYQHHDILVEELGAAAEARGLEMLYVDWRPYYRAGQAEAKRLGFYRQRYCGCEFSRQEAMLEQAARNNRQTT